MLRNIPNRIDQVCTEACLSTLLCSSFQAMLKSILDQTSFGQYDFMYLRIGKHISLFRYALILILFRLRQQLQVCLQNQSQAFTLLLINTALDMPLSTSKT